MITEDIGNLLAARTQQLQLMEGFVTRCVTALRQLRLTADDNSRLIIDEALAEIPFGLPKEEGP
jgi:hypothetical protein